MSPRLKTSRAPLSSSSMGNPEDSKKNMRPHNPSPMRSKLKILLLLISTNLLSVYLFSGGGAAVWPTISIGAPNHLLPEISATRTELSRLQRRLAAATNLIETLGREHADGSSLTADLQSELHLAAGPHKLPLGFNHNLRTGELFPAMGAACRRFPAELAQYMAYEAGGECPSDEAFAQRLMLKGCEPLPRRRCRPRSPEGFEEPVPLPASLWTTPPDSSVVWDAYSCKNFSCLIERGRSKRRRNVDCVDCFDLEGPEAARWMTEDGALGFGIDDVLAGRVVRIGLDIGGGSGTFAARMAERGVTVVSTTMNFDGPFGGFMAARGLVAMHVSVAHRLPFFDNTLDIVHSMHVLSDWLPAVVLEMALFDVYRVLRPGGLFWLDHFFCAGERLNATFVPMIEGIGFKKLRWATGRKLDRPGVTKNEWYLSALLEKPVT